MLLSKKSEYFPLQCRRGRTWRYRNRLTYSTGSVSLWEVDTVFWCGTFSIMTQRLLPTPPPLSPPSPSLSLSPSCASGGGWGQAERPRPLRWSNWAPVIQWDSEVWIFQLCSVEMKLWWSPRSRRIRSAMARSKAKVYACCALMLLCVVSVIVCIAVLTKVSPVQCPDDTFSRAAVAADSGRCSQIGRWEKLYTFPSTGSGRFHFTHKLRTVCFFFYAHSLEHSKTFFLIPNDQQPVCIILPVHLQNLLLLLQYERPQCGAGNLNSDE